MKKIINKEHFEGYLFGHDLLAKVSGEAAKTPGTPYIAGTINVATDDEGMNVVPVNFRYVTETTKAGKKNATFASLLNIIENGKTWQDVGPAATKLKIDTAVGINDFYNAEEELITYKINDGGFVHAVPMFTADRNSFELDMLITNTTVKEADEERGFPEVVVVKGYTFNFMNSILPIDLVVKNAGGKKYFEDLGATASEPILLKVWGHVTSSTVETQTTEESAFGEAAVKISTRNLREWEITGASTEPYAFGDDLVMTTAEVKDALTKREDMLVDVKQRHDEWAASKNAGTSAPAAGTPKAAPGKFKF